MAELTIGNNTLGQAEIDVIHRVLDTLEKSTLSMDDHKLILDIVRLIIPNAKHTPALTGEEALAKLSNTLKELDL